MVTIPDNLRARFERCRRCRASCRWGVDEAGPIWACVVALNGQIATVEACGGRAFFEARPGREEDFANRLEHPA